MDPHSLLRCAQLDHFALIASFGFFRADEYSFFGFPRFLIRDDGPGAFSAEWDVFANAHDICLITAHTGRSSQTGALERRVGLLKIGISRITSVSPEFGFWRRRVERQCGA